MTKRDEPQAETAKATESESVERRNADGVPLTQEQETQALMGETTQHDVEATSGLTPEAEQANSTRPLAEKETTTDGD